MRDHVRKRRRELGHAAGDVFVPQVNAPGVTAEVDWGEADRGIYRTQSVVRTGD